jgi:hypothetical protein
MLPYDDILEGLEPKDIKHAIHCCQLIVLRYRDKFTGYGSLEYSLLTLMDQLMSSLSCPPP